MLWLFLGMVIGCGYQRHIKRLDNEEYAHWTALRVFMETPDRKAYLSLKTRAERDAWLKENKLWDTFYQYEQNIRDKIVAGEVQTGWNRDMVLMSWGWPMEKRKEFRSSAVQSEKWIYKFELHKDGGVLVWEPDSKTAYKAKRLFLREIVIEDQGAISTADDIVTEIIQKD